PDPGVRDPRRLRLLRVGAPGVRDGRRHRRARRRDRAARRTEDEPRRVARSDGRQAAARHDLRGADAAELEPRQPPADLADGGDHQPRYRHRADGGDRQPRDRTADVQAIDVRQGRDGNLHLDGRRGDDLQLPAPTIGRGRSVRLRIADHHAHLGVPLHLARAPHHRRAHHERMKPITIAAAVLLVTVLVRLKPDTTVDTATYVASGFSRTLYAQTPKQAVVETSAGAFVVDLTPEAA